VSVVVPVGSVDGQLKRQIAAALAQDTPFSFEMILSLNSLDASDRVALDEIRINRAVEVIGEWRRARRAR
jgi:hypothetical protein